MFTKTSQTELLDKTAVMRCLRFGNTIAYNGQFVVVQCVTADYISVSGIENNRFTPIKIDDDLLSFIPITYDVLKEWNFNKRDFGHDTFYWELKNEDFVIIDRPTEIYDERNCYVDTDYNNRQFFLDSFNGDNKQLYFLHEIQNIAIDLFEFCLNIA